MAIKYVVIPETKTTIGILEHTEFDAIRKIEKMMNKTPFYCDYSKYLMPVSFKTSTVCDPRDEYSVEEGKRVVKEKLMKHYHESMDKKLNRFEADLKKFYHNVFVDDNTLI